jgi:hypothetical protein
VRKPTNIFPPIVNLKLKKLSINLPEEIMLLIWGTFDPMVYRVYVTAQTGNVDLDGDIVKGNLLLGLSTARLRGNAYIWLRL